MPKSVKVDGVELDDTRDDWNQKSTEDMRYFHKEYLEKIDNPKDYSDRDIAATKLDTWYIQEELEKRGISLDELDRKLPNPIDSYGMQSVGQL